MEDSPNEKFDLEVLENATSPTTLSDRSLWVLIGVLRYASFFQETSDAEFQREGNMITIHKKEGIVTQSVNNYYPEEAADIIWEIVKDLYQENRLLGENALKVLQFIREDTEKSVKYISSIYIELIDRSEYHDLLEDDIGLKIKMPNGFTKVIPIVAPSSDAREKIEHKLRSSQKQGITHFHYPISDINRSKIKKGYIEKNDGISQRFTLVTIPLGVIAGAFIFSISEIGIDITATQYSFVGSLCSIALVYILLTIKPKKEHLREEI